MSIEFCHNLIKYIKIANNNFLNNLPFNKFYSNIDYKKDDIFGFHIYYEKELITNICKVSDDTKYRNYSVNNKYICNDNITYYEREFKELEYMLKNNNYYNNFYYNNIKTENYNPNIYHSILCNDYVLSPTFSPYKNDHIVVISYNKKNN